MLTWRIRLVSCWIHDSTVSEILNISPALLSVMAILFRDGILWPLRSEIVSWMLFLNSSVMRICVWRWLRLNCARHLLTELTAIRILRHLILISLLLIILWTELCWLVSITWNLLLILPILVINRSLSGTIFRIWSIFWGTLRSLHWIIASTVSFHKLLTISVWGYWL